MFKLYTNLGSVGQWKLIDVTLTEKEIVQSILDHSNKCHLYNYIIAITKKDKDVVVRQILGEAELKKYLIEFKEGHRVKPLNDMTCLELKNYITKRNKTR